MELLLHGIKVVVRVLAKRFCGVLTVNEIQFGFTPEKGASDAMFMFRMLHKEKHIYVL